MATYSTTHIASSYFQVKFGGDAGALKGIMKTLLVMDIEQGNVVDHNFIALHTLKVLSDLPLIWPLSRGKLSRKSVG